MVARRAFVPLDSAPPRCCRTCGARLMNDAAFGKRTACRAAFDTDSRMPMDTEWQARVKGIPKAELKGRNVSYRDLAG